MLNSKVDSDTPDVRVISSACFADKVVGNKMLFQLLPLGNEETESQRSWGVSKSVGSGNKAGTRTQAAWKGAGSLGPRSVVCSNNKKRRDRTWVITALTVSNGC